MSHMTITPAVSGFLKGLLLVVIAAVVGFFSDAANLNGVLPPVLVTIVVALASAIESSIKASTGTALFGAVRVSKV